jgi:phage FluMu protein Com
MSTHMSALTQPMYTIRCDFCPRGPLEYPEQIDIVGCPNQDLAHRIARREGWRIDIGATFDVDIAKCPKCQQETTGGKLS